LWDEPQTIRVVCFGTFELDLAAGELCKKGLKVRLQDQPFELLAALAARPGEVVTREELKDKLWPSDTYVDFDCSLNTAASKLRDALGDSASSPRFIETLPRRGYRFLASVETVGEAADRDESSGVAADASRDGRESTSHEFEQRQRFLCFALAVTAAVAIVAVGLLVFQWLDQPSATGAMALRKFSFTPPDSEFIGLGTDKELKKISVEGAAAITLSELPGKLYFGGSWSPDGDSIVFASDSPEQFYEVPAGGGSPELFLDLEESEGGTQVLNPEFLPSEAAARSVVFAEDSRSDTEVVLKNLETGARLSLGTGAFPRHSSTGHIVYQTNYREGGLWALPFSIKTLQPTGEAFPIAQSVRFPSLADDGRFEGPPLFATEYVEKAAKLSPDGRYVAYVSDESGIFEVYVQRFPDGGEKLQISVSGGRQPRWSRDGAELFFVEDDALMVVQVGQGERLSVSAPDLLFRSAAFGTSPHAHYNVSSDGRRFILAEYTDRNSTRIRVVQNWYEEFRD